MSKRPLLVGIGLSVLIVAATAVALSFMGKKPQAAAALFSDKVAVVEIQGVIAKVQPILEDLDELRRDASVRAVVLRVDSPGGGAAASQEIYAEVSRLKAVKPVVCSMGSVAASGGYYVASPCTRIMANPSTITGSLSVISQIPDLEKLMATLGVRMQIIKTGELKAAGNMYRPLNEAERKMLETALEDTHQQFVRDVAKARGLPEDKVSALATGAIYTGRRAKQLGLVDNLGNFNDAVRLAAKLGGISGRPTLVRPQGDKPAFWRKMLSDQTRALVSQLWSELGGLGGLSCLYLPAAPPLP